MLTYNLDWKLTLFNRYNQTIKSLAPLDTMDIYSTVQQWMWRGQTEYSSYLQHEQHSSTPLTAHRRLARP